MKPFDQFDKDKATIWLLFIAAFAALFLTETSVGFVQDESVYFYAAERYTQWLWLLLHSPALALRDDAIVAAFDYNHEHPALMKLSFGISHWLFTEQLGWLRPAAGFRLPAFAIAACIPPLLYQLGRPLFGRTAGLFGALSFFLVPRQFFNAQLACFDIPVAALWLWVVYLFWRAQTEPKLWILCGFAFGLSIATKHNALFLPFVLTPFALWRAWVASAGNSSSRRAVIQFIALLTGAALFLSTMWAALGSEQFVARFTLLSPQTFLILGAWAGAAAILLNVRSSPETFRPLATLGAMMFLGPVVFYLHWPYLWHAPVDRTAWYLQFHATHVHYAWFYLGKLLRESPFPLEYVWVKTALTVPTSLFVPMILGLVTVLITKTTRRWEVFLIAANALASIILISHPQVPHFGGVKHWFPSMTFLSLLAGVSVSRAANAIAELGSQPWQKRIAAPALFVLLLLPAAIATAHFHPYGTSAYSELAGGAPGAATLGMQRQFWSNNVTGVLPWINSHAPPNARLWLDEVTGLAFHHYQRNGMLRPDIRSAGSAADSDLAAYQYHQEFREHEYSIWQAYGTEIPVTGLYVDETPQVVVYQRR